MMRLHRPLTLAIAALALASVASADDAVKITRTYKLGDSARYRTKITTNVNGTDVVATMTAKQTVKEVKPNGDVVITLADEGGTLNIGGQDQEAPGGTTETLTRDKLGRFLDLKSEDNPNSPFAPEITKLITMWAEVPLPDKDVKAGDTWSVDLDNPVVKGKKVTIKSTFNGVDKSTGTDLWKVKVTSEAITDADGNKTSADFNVYLTPATGQIAKADGKVKDLPTRYGPMSWDQTVELVKPDDKKPEDKKPAGQ